MNKPIFFSRHPIDAGQPRTDSTPAAWIEQVRGIRFNWSGINEFYYGDVDKVRWPTTTALLPPVKKIVCLATGKAESDFAVRPFLREIENNFALPGIGLISLDNRSFNLELVKKTTLMLSVFCREVITTRCSDAQSELFPELIVQSERDILSNIAQEYLASLDSRLVGEEVYLCTPAGKSLISGRYRQCAETQLPAPASRTIIGRVDGFHGQKRTIFVLGEKNETTPIRFEEIRFKPQIINALANEKEYVFLVETDWTAPKKMIQKLISFEPHST